MVNYSYSPITQVEDRNKRYTANNIKIYDHTRRPQNITGKSIKRLFYEIDNNIMQKLPMLQEDNEISEDIYGTSITHLEGKTAQLKFQHVESVKIPSVPKIILDKYKEVTILCDLMHINGIGLLNTIPRYIMFAAGIIINNRKLKNSEGGITQVHKLYLHCEFNITRMRSDSGLNPLRL